MTIGISVEKITFSGNDQIRLESDDVILIVGPNNSGKSATLKSIKEMMAHAEYSSKVINTISLNCRGTLAEFEKLYARYLIPGEKILGSDVYSVYGERSTGHSLKQLIGYDIEDGVQDAVHLFCCVISTEKRLSAADPRAMINLTTEPSKHPIHDLLRDDQLELEVSKKFRQIFGEDLIVHRSAGSVAPVFVGNRPLTSLNKDRISREYLNEVESLPQIQDLGDGLRSAAGILLFTSVGQFSCMLIDEPEAFLHPPQAYMIGRMLVESKPTGQQLFIATHSVDVVRGVLDGKHTKTRVLRIRRDRNSNLVRQLNSDQINAVWKDPLLRYSNILDGLFHEKVVVCEGDADCRFYNAIADTVFEREDNQFRKPDLMFTHCGGVGRMPMVLGSLREMDVPVVAVCDFDVLKEENLIKQMIETMGGSWAEFESAWKTIKQSIESRRPERSASTIKQDIHRILDGISGQNVPDSAAEKIREVISQASPWTAVKSLGVSYLPAGEVTIACEQLISKLLRIGIAIVPIGELEKFDPTVGGHGPRWVNEVMKKNLIDARFDASRKFVSTFLGL